jgi:hypothetical protein
VARVADAPAHVPLAEPVRVTVRRVARARIPDGDGFGAWLDEQWLAADAALRDGSAGAAEVAART